MTRALLLALCTLALPALAWEGTIDTKLTAGTGERSMNGTGTISIKGLSARMDSSLEIPTGPIKMTTITRAEEPGITYVLNDQEKTYQRLDAKKERADAEPGKWTVKRLGKETIAGRTTEHVQVAREGSTDQNEVWVDTQLVSASDLAKAFSSGGGGSGWWKALEKEGLAGVPLKFIAKGKDGKEHAVWEATKVSAKSVPASLFKVPDGYTEGGGMGMGPGTPSLNKLSPEQRKKLEEMMKKQGAEK